MASKNSSNPPQNSGSEPSIGAAVNQSAQRPRAIVLDDDPQVGDLQRIYLEELGFNAEVVSDTTAAMFSIAAAPPALLVIDFKLSEPTNGLEFYRTLLDKGWAIPAVLVTALGYEEVLVEAMHLGVRGFVLKTPTYWRDFNETVQRVMRTIAAESEALEAKAAKESEAKVQAALDAASVGYWRWDTKTGAFTVSAVLKALLEVAPATPVESSAEFVAHVLPADQPKIESFLEAARNSTHSLREELRVRTAAGGIRWMIIKGGTPAGAVGVVTGAVSDVTAQKEAQEKLTASYREISSLNQQLEASMVETHHRVKNSLQIVNSLVNIELRRGESFTAQDLRKLSAHIQAFATLHDILAEQSKELSSNHNAQTKVGAHEILARLLEILVALSDGRLVVDRLDSVWVSPRQSAALGLLLNELVSNAIKHGVGPIRLCFESAAERCSLSVCNDGGLFPENFSPQDTNRTGLKLMHTIARVELGSELEFTNTTQGARAEVSFRVAPLAVSTSEEKAAREQVAVHA